MRVAGSGGANTVTQAAGGTITLTARVHQGSKADLATLMPPVVRTRNLVNMALDNPVDRRFFFCHHRRAMDFDLKVPPALFLKLAGVDRVITVLDRVGGGNMSSVNGPITATRLKGKVEVKAVNGPANLSDIRSLSRSNLSTDLMSKALGGCLTTETINGLMTLAVSLIWDCKQATIRLVNGAITIYFAPGQTSRLTIKGFHATPNIELPGLEITQQEGFKATIWEYPGTGDTQRDLKSITRSITAKPCACLQAKP